MEKALIDESLFYGIGTVRFILLFDSLLSLVWRAPVVVDAN